MRDMQYVRSNAIEGVSPEAFQKQRPYPWVTFQGTLTEPGFERLRETLPDVSLFERHVGAKRAFGQGYHDRYLLHYHPGLPLAEPWREFIAEIEGPGYRSFIRRIFGLPATKSLILTLEWYYAWQGCGVSPHCDAPSQTGYSHLLFQHRGGLGCDLGRQYPDHGRRRATAYPFGPEFR